MTLVFTFHAEAEFFVPLERAQPAMHAVWATAREWSFSSPWGHQESQPAKGLVDAMEFRQVKGDGAWLSPQPVDSLGIHISFNADPAYRDQVLREALPALEEALAPFGARAHWGKLGADTFDLAQVEALYGERLKRFRALAQRHDPSGKFRNAHLRRTVFGEHME
jgi:alditol oxidase